VRALSCPSSFCASGSDTESGWKIPSGLDYHRDMVYTCFEMVRDCRADRPEGWSYFITNYVPVIRRFVLHYRPDRDGKIDDVLLAIRNPGAPAAGLFASVTPVPEREFLAALRQQVLDILDVESPLPEPEISIDLDTLTAALEPLTLLEKQAVWLETMGYDPPEAGALLRTGAAAIEKMRENAGARLRGKMDNWRLTLLSENGRQLGRSAAGAATPQCLASKLFLDLLDGRTTWGGREDLERHVRNCWHCIDHYCRLLEAAELARRNQPLSEPEALPFRKLLGVTTEKPSAWRRLFGAG
jgi:hypothetical protein